MIDWFIYLLNDTAEKHIDTSEKKPIARALSGVNGLASIAPFWWVLSPSVAAVAYTMYGKKRRAFCICDNFVRPYPILLFLAETGRQK